MSPLIRHVLRGAFYLATTVVGVVSLAPAAALPPMSVDDKAQHLLAYALLGLLGGMSARGGVLRTIVGLAAFGVAIEMLQTFSPGRSPDVFDVLANTIGAVAGCGAVVALRFMASTVRERPAGAGAGAAAKAERPGGSEESV